MKMKNDLTDFQGYIQQVLNIVYTHTHTHKYKHKPIDKSAQVQEWGKNNVKLIFDEN